VIGEPVRDAPAGRAVLWIVPALLALHNLEEALTFSRSLPVARERVPSELRDWVGGVTPPRMLIALAVVTIVPVLIVAWERRTRSRVALWSVLLVQATLLLNVVPHIASAIALGGYAPGAATAVLVNLPFSIHLLRRAIAERWLDRPALLALAPGAMVVHGPVLLGLLALAGAVAGR
jgi:hypothetical protein